VYALGALARNSEPLTSVSTFHSLFLALSHSYFFCSPSFSLIGAISCSDERITGGESWNRTNNNILMQLTDHEAAQSLIVLGFSFLFLSSVCLTLYLVGLTGWLDGIILSSWVECHWPFLLPIFAVTMDVLHLLFLFLSLCSQFQLEFGKGPYAYPPKLISL
jgi:hypothetical protein